MNPWARVPRGIRDRVSAILPDWWWLWLHQLREIGVDRSWSGVTHLRRAYPGLAATEDELATLHNAELRVYSQNGEDGIMAHLLDRIGVTNRQVVEFGCGDGSECCSALLLRHFGWTGLLLDGRRENVEEARRFHAGTRAFRMGALAVLEALVEPDTVNELLSRHVDVDVDLASIDIDGNDYWVWKALESVRPRLIVIEFNSTFGPERCVTIPYARGFDRYRAHPSGFYHGASLAALAKLGGEKGYILAGCDSRGTNAFFVRADAAEGVVSEVAVDRAFTTLYERRHLSVSRQFEQISHLPLVEV